MSRFLLLVLVAGMPSQEGDVEIPTRHYDADGKVICTSGYKAYTCNAWDKEVIISMKGSLVPAGSVDELERLGEKFREEAFRQHRLCQKKSAKQYYDAYLERADGGQGRAPGNCLNSDELAKIVEERRVFLGPLEKDYERAPEWRLRGGFLYGGVTMPAGTDRFGEYSKRTKKKLAKLRKKFVLECFAQQIAWNRGAETVDPRLLRLALQAAHLQASNMPAKERVAAHKEWSANCKPAEQEPRADRNTRFLLSRALRGDAGWVCHGAGGGAYVEDCGNIKSDDGGADITSQLRKAAPMLKVRGR